MFDLTPFDRRHREVWDPFRDFEKFFSVGPDFHGFRTDIKDRGDKFVLEAELPGFAKEDIHIDVDSNYLTISAERNEGREDSDKEGGYLRRERSYGSFRRSFDVSNIRTEAIKASYRDGVLSLDLPKKDGAAPSRRRLDIE